MFKNAYFVTLVKLFLITAIMQFALLAFLVMYVRFDQNVQKFNFVFDFFIDQKRTSDLED